MSRTRSSLLCIAAAVLAVLPGRAAPARLSPMPELVSSIEFGATIFANRPFTFTQQVAEPLRNMAYVQFPNDKAIAVSVIEAGDLAVLTPVPGVGGLSKSVELERQGFQRDAAFGTRQPFGSGRWDQCGLWRKHVEKGERIVLTKCWSVICGFDPANQPNRLLPPTPKEQRIMARTAGCPAAQNPRDILVNKPDYVVFVPRSESKGKNDKLSREYLAQRGDRYNDHFQVIWDDARKLYYAFWTQASWEGCSDQHIAFSKSADRGKTWSEPVVLAGSENRAYPKLRASWQQPMLAKSGRLYCLWNQQTTTRGPHFGQCFGSFSDDAGDTWYEPQQLVFSERMDQDDPDPLVPPCWCNWQRPLRLGAGGRFFVGCSRHGKAPYDAKSCCKIEFWQFENIDDNPRVPDIRISFFSKNRDALDSARIAPIPGVKYFVPTLHPWGHPEDPAIEEAAIMKLPDGRLFAVMRSSIGSPVWSQSRDGGKTWSGARALLNHDGGVPYKHPRSPCPFYDWKGPEAGSGIYFGLVHNTFDMTQKTAYQARGKLYLIAGRFDPKADQPVSFAEPKLFAPRPYGNSFYTSYTVSQGEGVLWFNDKKYYLLGRKVGPEWFK